MRSLHFNNDEFMERVKTWLSPQVANFFDIDIQKLISRHNGLSFGGDYVEKLLKYVHIVCP
jgi:hypothetical protein